MSVDFKTYLAKGWVLDETDYDLCSKILKFPEDYEKYIDRDYLHYVDYYNDEKPYFLGVPISDTIAYAGEVTDVDVKKLEISKHDEEELLKIARDVFCIKTEPYLCMVCEIS